MSQNIQNLHLRRDGNTRGTNSPNLFSIIERWFRMEHGIPVKVLPKLFFVAFLGLLYIGNTHLAQKMIRKITAMKTEIEDLRTDYITLKAEFMVGSKQSEVARKVKSLGLVELSAPPKKINITQ